MTVYYNDNAPFCCRVLRKQIAAGNLPQGFVDERDIREVTAADLAGYRQIHLFAGIGGFPLGFRWTGVPEELRLITGGFPCQDISDAGKRVGIDGERSGLWREYARIIRVFRPDHVVVENSSAILGRGLGRVLGDLAALGFDAEWSVVSACSLGAPHTRERVFVVAHANGEHGQEWLGFRSPRTKAIQPRDHGATHRRWVDAVTREDRSPDGIPNRMERVGALGNAIVPQVAELVGRRLMETIHA